MKFEKEKNFMINEIQHVFKKYFQNGIESVEQKTQFDLVTNIDYGIEKELAEKIQMQFPGDHILGEETSNQETITGRTWTIDPIDGTCNMASKIPLYGVQCALFEDGEVVFAIIYLPSLNEVMVAEKGNGCFLNGHRVYVNNKRELNNALVSFGDYPHLKNIDIAEKQHNAIKNLYSKIAKIRMFGAACYDFLFVACGRTDGTVVITRNLWDIAPGILMCREAGAILTNLDGNPYRFGDDGVVACATNDLSNLIKNAFCN